MSLPRGARLAAATLLSSSLLAVAVAGPLPAATSASPACGKQIGVMGALTGDAGVLGQNIANGVKLAVSKYNAAHPGCGVEVVLGDTQGDPSQAPPIATFFVGQSHVLGVVGPAFSGESLASGKTFSTAGLATITPSAANPLVSKHGWKTFHRLIANDHAVGLPVATYIKTKLHAKKVAVVTDGEDYGRTFVRGVKVPLGKKVVATGTVGFGQKNFSALVRKIRAKKATVVVFGGFYDEGGRLAKQLVAAGWRGRFVGGDGVMDPGFAKAAGATAAARAYVVSGTAPATLSPSFTQAYKAAYGSAPGPYSLEAYDSANVFLAAIGNGAGTRAAVLGAVNHYDAKGLTKQIRFSSTGELVKPPVWVYKPAGTGFKVRTRLS